MKLLTIILIVISLASCLNREQVDVNSIKIERINQHPFLTDHDRKLITLDKNQQTINELEIYPDSGAGCDAFLFDAGSKYILIDCNGQWFSIDKTDGTLKNEGWKWNEVPDNPLGRFQVKDKELLYIYSPGSNFKQGDIYKYKDPR